MSRGRGGGVKESGVPQMFSSGGAFLVLVLLGPLHASLAFNSPSSSWDGASGARPTSTALMAKKHRVAGATTIDVNKVPHVKPVTVTPHDSHHNNNKHDHQHHHHNHALSSNAMIHNHLRAVHLRQIRSQGKNPVLILNADYQPLSFLPLSVCSWKEAIKAIWLDRVIVVDHYEKWIRTSSSMLQLPSVIRLKKYVNIHQETPSLHRRNLYLRDGYQCQYCGARPATLDELSLDHIIPRCEGGGMDWENVVTACTTCNHRKGKRSLRELKDIGLSLMSKPRKPTIHEIVSNARKFSPDFIHETWQPYFS